MKKAVLIGMAVLLLVLAVNPYPANTNKVLASPPEPPLRAFSAPIPGNLLTNGDFDNPIYPFYWRPTNHFVGGMWYEWFAVEIPEFIDGGITSHNVCYPEPPPGKLCVENEHNSSQGYIRWGAPYVAGIYQPVTVTPCQYYKFEMYNRNDDPHYHPKVGIDPTGQGLPAYIPPDGNGLPVNCPPDGKSKCPNPGLKSPADLPPNIVWSPEFDHAAYTWASQSVIAEAVSTTVTVWTYAAPEAIGPLSTYWDYGSLIQVPSPSGMLISGTLPSPDGAITGVTTATTAFRANIAWQTNGPAVSQVLYHYVGDATMPSPPPIAGSAADYELHTPIDMAWSIAHSVRLPSLRPMSLYDYAILSRRLVGGACQTSVVTGRVSTTDILAPAGRLPAPSSDITGLTVLPFETSAYVIWQSAQPAYAQVLYHYMGPVTATIPLTATNHIYLPLITSTSDNNGSTYDYELKTAPTTGLDTLHIIKLSGLYTSSRYSLVGISAWSDGDQDKVAASNRTVFFTQNTPTMMAASAQPDQWIEQLQVCMVSEKDLTACIDKLTK